MNNGFGPPQCPIYYFYTRSKPQTAELNFHPLEVMSRSHDTPLQVLITHY